MSKPSAAAQRPELPCLPVWQRIAALLTAATVCSVVVGSMMGIAAMYSGEAEQALAKVWPEQAGTRVVAQVGGR